MVNEKYKAMLSAKNVIRNLNEFAHQRAAEIGYENVFDYTLGNPSVPCPDEYTQAVIDMYKEMNPMQIHGYSPTLGIPHVRDAVAKNLAQRFGVEYTADHIFMTSGAAGAVAHAIRVVTKPGDTVITFAPFFSEYTPYIEGAGCNMRLVPADEKTFQVNFEKFEEMLDETVMAVLINTPNNPSGVTYNTTTMERFASILEAKQKEYGHDIFLICDDPYREIVFAGADAPYPSKFYDNSISCYSYSKSLSIPGERIGYVAVNPKATDAKDLVVMCGQVSRGIGHNCPSSTAQLAIAKVIDKTSDVSVYETNMNLIYDALVEIGFEVVKPSGTFYIFPKALEEDAIAFCEKAMKYDLIFVPAGTFGCPSHFRIAYCIDTEKVKRSIPVLKKFAREVYGMNC
ncbi:MAG: pyridoxal phosphate-dependent aminotransferase [Clostridia bacterium]|nr:pyridoxal phosphate-dependent aminotransferase [Clostridia bacterium]